VVECFKYGKKEHKCREWEEVEKKRKEEGAMVCMAMPQEAQEEV